MNEFTSTTALEQTPAQEQSGQDQSTQTPVAQTATPQGESGEFRRYIPLNKLIASPINARKSDGGNIDELAMLIDSQGLLMDLLVIPHVTKKGKATDTFEVVAGGRRRRALMRLAEVGKIAPDEKIMCKLTTKARALAMSVAENSGREPMSKPDTVQAFAAMAATGATPEDIAVSFGITPLTVMRRLKLANVSPKLFELYRAEKITTEQMMALAIVDDHETQERVWAGASHYDRHPSTLRRLALGREIDASRDPMALYVGVKAYQEAGGRIIRDLFQEDPDCGFVGDAELLHQLASEKLQDAADKLLSEGWKWTEARTRFDYGDRTHFGVASTTLRAPTEKERAKLAAFEKEQQDAESKLEEMYESEDDDIYDRNVADALERAAERAGQGIEKLHAAMRMYSAETLAVAGAVATIDQSGQLAVHRGLIKPEDKKEAKKVASRTPEGNPAGSIEDGDDKPSISEALQRKLTAHRTKALQVSLAVNIHVALAAVVHVLLQQVVEVGYVDSALSIRGSGCDGALQQFAGDMKDSKAYAEMESRLDSWRERLPGHSDKLLPWLIAKDQDTLLELLALCAALSVNTVTAREQEHPGDALVKAVALDMADFWEPTGTSYFAQVSKAQIAEAVGEAVSAEAGSELLKLKKGEAVAKAEALMAGTRWLPRALRPR